MRERLEELNRNFDRDNDLRHSSDMRDIQISLKELRELRSKKTDEKNLSRQLEITEGLLEKSSEYIKKNEKKIEKVPEEKRASEKKKLDAMKDVLDWITEDTEKKNVYRRLDGADLGEKAADDLKEKYRKLEAEAKRAEKSTRTFKWNSQKKHGQIKSVKITDKLQRKMGKQPKGKVSALKEDGTEKVKTYADGKRIKVVSGQKDQFIRSETGYKTQEEKKQLTSLFGLMKESRDKNIAAQRDANERDMALKEKRAEISRQNREQVKGGKGIQIGGHREKDNSFKAELDRGKERKTNLKLGAHREPAKTDSLEKKNVVRRGREM